MKVCRKHLKNMDINERNILESTEGIVIVKTKDCQLHKLDGYFKTHGFTKGELKGFELRGHI